MYFANPYWSEKTKMELLQKWILVHSIIYYELNTSIVSDSMFDANSYQLVRIIRINSDEFKRTKWYYAFKDFDGSTGFDLYKKLKKKHKSELLSIAHHLISRYGKGDSDG